jgi:hypothetical protein
MRHAFARLTQGLVIMLFSAAALPALAADVTRPNVGAASPETATAGAAVTISAPVSDDESGIASCRLYVDNEDAGGMNVSFVTATISYVFGQAGVHTIFVFCRDVANNFNSGPSTSMLVAVAPPPPSGSPSPPPSVGQIAPLVATVGLPVTISAAVSDAASCLLFVNGFSKGAMTLLSGTASREQTFDAAGSYSVYVQCFNGAGSSASGPEANLVVTVQTAPLPQPDLIKMACPAEAAVDHPCKAVYYRDTDGKRHAFPNAQVFFTWYADFAGVKEVSSAELSASPLGKQVTYRPGSKLVKFTTLNNVYAVAKGGTLRWIKSEAAAAALYGADWNKKVDDISDAFYLNYTFGADIAAAGDYSPSAEMAATTTISQNF